MRDSRLRLKNRGRKKGTIVDNRIIRNKVVIMIIIRIASIIEGSTGKIIRVRVRVEMAVGKADMTTAGAIKEGFGTTTTARMEGVRMDITIESPSNSKGVTISKTGAPTPTEQGDSKIIGRTTMAIGIEDRGIIVTITIGMQDIGTIIAITTGIEDIETIIAIMIGIEEATAVETTKRATTAVTTGMIKKRFRTQNTLRYSTD
jgi:hypothetical protein